MRLPNCAECGKLLVSKNAARKHYQREHAGEIETPEEYLPNTESEQRDFNGEEPDDSDYKPEYLTETETVKTEKTNLGDFE